MDQDQIKYLLKKKIKSIKHYCRKIDKGFNQEDIHDFRVEVKKLRSFLKVLRLCDNNYKLRLPKRFKRLYQIAGAVRDAQLEYDKLSEKENELPRYISKLKHLIIIQEQEWKKHYTPKTIHKLEKRLLDIEYPTLDLDTIISFYKKKIDQITTLSHNEDPSFIQVHNLRKQIKDLLYVAKLTKKELKGAGEYSISLPMKELDNLAKIIGDFNDKRNTLEHLKNFSSKHISPLEVAAIDTICNEDTLLLETEKNVILEMAQKIGATKTSKKSKKD
jgi:CHAD domain-containing protein